MSESSVEEYTDESSSSLSLQSMEDSRPRADFSQACASPEELKCTLNYSSYTKLQECNESVGPSEELDEDFKPHYDSVKAYVTSSVGTNDDVPQQLCTKLDHVQSLAKSVNTNVYRAADILETLNSAFVYGRSASSDPFQLEEATKKSLDSFDSSFKRFLEGRVNAEFDQADQELTKCKQSVEKAVDLARQDSDRRREREKAEDREVTMSDLETTLNEATDGIREDKTELEGVAQRCTSDINRIDESLYKRKVLWGKALVDYTNERTERESELTSNRSRQHQLEQELRALKERETVLVRLSKNRADEQARSNMEYERVVKEIADWKEQVETLYQQAQASLKIVDTMSECTSLVMEDAKRRKREWKAKLADMELENLLQLRDALMAHASIHLMESDDCKSTITTIKRDIVTAKEEKSKHSKMGYKEGLQEAKTRLKSLEGRLQVYHSKMEEHDREVQTVRSELKDTDELIRKLRPNFQLDSLDDRYAKRRRGIDRVFDEDDVNAATFCSHGNYKYTKQTSV